MSGSPRTAARSYVSDRTLLLESPGYQLIEGFLVYKVWTLFTVMFRLVSLVFAVARTI